MRASYFAILLIFVLQFATNSYADDILDQNKSADTLFTGAALVTEDEFLPVEEAYILNTAFEQDGRIRLNWQIAEGYYLYRHSFNFELTANGQAIEAAIEIPPGLEKTDEYFGQVEVYYHNLDIMVGPIPTDAQVQLIVTSQGCADAGLCYPPRDQYFHIDTVDSTISTIDNAVSTSTNIVTTQPSASVASLPYMMLLAMLGGIILNLMPCVFPVLSLKVLAFANDKNHSQTVHGLVYSAGVILSFVAVAAVLVSLQAAGEAIGWGFHLQSPWFVAALTYLFFVMGLSLSGFIEFGGSLMNIGGNLAQKSGYSGSFFTGILATIVASPCTAPFMGTALGFAVTQPTAIALLIFGSLGFGMALPVLLLSYSPRLLAKIPKPGPWMEKLKEILAFPLYATAVWLAWVVGNQTGVNGMAALMLGCVLITMAIWFWNGKTASRIIAASCAILAIALVVSPLLKHGEGKLQAAGNGEWQAYSPQALANLRQQGKPVFINITADWCITCLANERVTLSTDTVKNAMKNSGVVYMKGDWTNRDPQITQLLKEYGRNGIPLYIVYPTGTGDRGKVLPQILTIDAVVEAISDATSSNNQLSLR